MGWPGRISGVAAAALLGAGLVVAALDLRALAPGEALDETAPPAAPVPAAPAGGPTLEVSVPEDYRWAEAETRELLTRCQRSLARLYGVNPPYRWRVSYEGTRGPARYDLPSLPVYLGQGRLQMSVEYLAAPPDDDRWAQADTLGTLEGLAYGYHEYLGLDRTDLSEGLAAVTARDLGGALWGGLRATELNALILIFEDREVSAVRYWRETGAPPEGMEPAVWDRQRAIVCWREATAGISPDAWRSLFAELAGSGRPLTRVGDTRQGNRLLAEALGRVTAQDCARIFRAYGYEL
jgi:hypothetical protein